MVLFKRKPVRFLMSPAVNDDSAEVWLIPQTGEILATYEEYLNRMDFYKQRRFICQITGHSGLTFFEALTSELAGAAEVEQAFPESLKGPILRRVQFQTVSRIDHLVDMMYDEFKDDYYPGENVTVQIHSGDRLQGVVRDKTRFGSKVLPDGTLTQPFSRYIVSLDQRPDDEAVVDSEHIWRDRKVFTKSVLRSFIKKTVTREAWNGAPWLVKHEVAEHYHIDTRVPPHLRYDNKLLERKQLLAQKKTLQPTTANGAAPGDGSPPSNGNNPFHASGPMRLPDLKPAPKSHKAKHLQHPPQQQPQHPPPLGKGRQNGFVHPDDPARRFMHLPIPGNPFGFPVSIRSQAPPPLVYAPPEPPRPPPPPKYPIEDLQLEPRGVVRPQLRFLCNDPPAPVSKAEPFSDKILMKSVGPLLETWDTLNVYCEVFKLDSFTFDDYVESLVMASEGTRCQLHDEIHCAVLSILVNSDKDGGELQVELPDQEDDDEDEDEEEDESKAPTPEPEPQPARATRGSLAKAEAERLANAAAAAAAEEQSGEEEVRHRAQDVLKDYDWVEHCAKREFQDGGWELIIVGLLNQLSMEERRKPACDDLLSQLVPLDVEPTKDTVRQHYDSLDVNARVSALQIICMLTTETKAIRGYMEECSETMTDYRKNKIEFQRQRRTAIEELKALNEERKILLPDNMPPSPQPEPARLGGGVEVSDNESMSPAIDEDTIVDTEEDAPTGRALRRAQDRAAQRRRQRELEQERREKAEAAAKVPKQSKQFLKVLKDIEKKEEEIRKCEEEIAVIDNDLREADCPRTRVLGKDRFWNRYYWFERNGMPYAGLPSSSTAAAEYANGCIWVQGPDELEREGYIDVPAEQQNEYRARFNMTIPERKAREEGQTSVVNAHQWGFISDPADVMRLIEWLDQRGFNEFKLRKELVAFRERIETHMENRRKYLGIDAQEKEAKEQEEREKELEQEKEREREQEREREREREASGKRMSTRTRAPASASQPASSEAAKRQSRKPAAPRCPLWENLTAINDLGHLHSQHPPPSRVKRPTRKEVEAAAAAAAPEKKKTLSRQGTRYNFQK